MLFTFKVIKIRRVILFFLLFFSSLSAFAENITNEDPSPYVRMHANDAVKWQRWDKSVLDRAKKENKLILISSGYYACHWCHVMRRESFTDEKVARLLNKNFIPVKIDRELSPSLDGYLMEFMHHTQGYGGWPLNVFITPQGYPLTGLVYLPRDEFIDVLNNMQRKWLTENKKLKDIALNTFNYTQKINADLISASGSDLFNKFMSVVTQSADELEGGFGNKLKFPMPDVMLSLVKIYEQKPDAWLNEFISYTLQQMATKGLHDVIGGGFFRYTTDQSWQTPHFEKMLYTNAAMIKLYVKAYQVLGDRRWLLVAEETMDFVIRDMQDNAGAYVSTLNSQDSLQREGGNYLWDKRDLMQKLSSDEAVWFKKNTNFVDLPEADGFMPVGLWQGNMAQQVRKKLLAARATNPLVKDDKMVVSWNAYLLSAMIDLIHVTENRFYKNQAESLYKIIRQQAAEGLLRNQQGNPQHFLEDYAFTATTLWQWNRLQGNEKDRQIIENLLQQITDIFVQENGWRETDVSLIPLPGVHRNLKDGNLPSAEVLVLELLNEMKLTNEQVLKKIQNLSDTVDKRMLEKPLEYSTFITMKKLQSK